MIRRVEICVFSIEDAITAAEAGADRLEVCVNYHLGGISMPIEELTELADRLKKLNFVNAQGKIKAAVMCRPRGGDFVYSANEFSLLTNYASTVAKLGFEALVSGLLKVENDQWVLDEAGISSLISICKENHMEFVFHRAFDELKDPNAALKSLSLLGVNRVLSGWGQMDWSTFLWLIAEAKRLEIDLLPGGGIRSGNVEDYWAEGVDFVHSAAGSVKGGQFSLNQQEMISLLASRFKSVGHGIIGFLCLFLAIFGIAHNSIGQDIQQVPSPIRTKEIPIQSALAPETYKQFRLEQWKLQLLDGKAADSTDNGLLQHGDIRVSHTPSINDVFCKHLVTGCTDVCKKIEWYSWKYSALIFSSAKEAVSRKHWIMELRQWEGAEISVFINGNLIEETYQPFASAFAQKMLVLDPFLRRDGQDSIVILFQAPTPLAKQIGYKSGMVFPADNEGPVPEVKASPWLRKPIVQYGWDIAPRRVLVGLGEGVWVTGWDEAYIQRVQVLVDSVVLLAKASGKNGKNASIQEDELPPMHGEFASGKIRLIYMKDAYLGDISLVKSVSMVNCSDVMALDGWQWKSSEQDQFRTYYVEEQSGIEFTMAELPFEVQKPYLWNPKRIQLKSKGIKRKTRSKYQREIEYVTMDYESVLPIMYSIGINIHIKNAEGVNRIVSSKTRTGIRKIFWDTSSGKFAFSINQQPIFVQGANVVWARHFQPNSPYPDGIMHRWFDLWSSSGLNAVRIWGGGSYPSERFYELCDSFGIMVWQDFMFSGTTYPKDPIFLNAVEIEVHNTVNQLASHPSLLIWCGNNEIEVAWKNWGWQQKYGMHGRDSVEHWQNYLFMFDTLIPGIVKECNPTVPYLRSSPVGNWGNLQQMKRGDNHDWGVWHGERGFNHLDSVKTPFCSEYGFPSVSWELKSAVKSTHELSAYMLSYKGLDLMVRYMLNSNNPSDKSLINKSLSISNRNVVKGDRDSLFNINYFAYQSWVKQNEYLIKAYNQHRSQMPQCMGSLFWQWNDIWPGITWSVMGISEPKPSAQGILQEMSKHALKR